MSEIDRLVDYLEDRGKSADVTDVQKIIEESSSVLINNEKEVVS